MSKFIGKIIFAIDTVRGQRPKLQYDAVKQMLDAKGLLFEETFGVYLHDDGTKVKETTFVVEWTNTEAYRASKAIAEMFNQESILLVDSDEKCYIRKLDQRTEDYVGKWTKVENIKDLDETKPYTRIGDNYYVAKI